MKRKSAKLYLLKKLITLALILAFGSCGFFRAPGKDSCDKILSREQMTEILTDVYLLEAYLRELRQHTDAADDSAKIFYQALFQRYKVEPDIFQEALDCYLLDRREMDLIHEQIMSDLSIRESEIERILKDMDR